MNDWSKVNELKASILLRRRQRIRRSTYGYVAEAMLEDTILEHPYRDRLVLDWWHRVVDPLDAESFDEERLRYFRKRLKEDRQALSRNAAIRQGLEDGDSLRRLSAAQRNYFVYQVRRLSDPRLNYAAARQALDGNDAAYRQMFLGLVALPRLSPGNGRWLDGVAHVATQDPRSKRLLAQLAEQSEVLLPGIPPDEITERVAQLTNLVHPVWIRDEDHIAYRREAGLIRKLEEEYSINFK